MEGNGVVVWGTDNSAKMRDFLVSSEIFEVLT